VRTWALVLPVRGSESLTTPVGRDNLWRRNIEPPLKAIKLDWATFQIMRRTHASLSRKAGIDPKLVADQLGHGIGVNLDTYTIADLDQRLAAVNTLEQSMTSPSIN
jgi:integrase